MQKRPLFFAWGLSLAVLGTFLANAWADWHSGSGVAYSAGNDGATEWNPNDPNNDGRDGEFDWHDGDPASVATDVVGCCIAAPDCSQLGPGWQPGVEVTATMTATDGTSSKSRTNVFTCCPATCCTDSCGVFESDGNPLEDWGEDHKPESVSVTVTVKCICSKGTTQATDPEWPKKDFGTEVLEEGPDE